MELGLWTKKGRQKDRRGLNKMPSSSRAQNQKGTTTSILQAEWHSICCIRSTVERTSYIRDGITIKIVIMKSCFGRRRITCALITNARRRSLRSDVKLATAVVRHPSYDGRKFFHSDYRRQFASIDYIQPSLDTNALQQTLESLGPSIAKGLCEDGFWTNIHPLNTDDDGSRADVDVVPLQHIRTIREECIALREEGRFEQSWSEKVVNGQSIRFDKEGVFACEPDGGDYETAPDMLMYMSTLITTLPVVLNQACNDYRHPSSNSSSSTAAVTPPLNLSNRAFNAKLAVTSPGGSTYPLHIDNTLGVTGLPNDDIRKLTCILYLNPEYVPGDGGELRLFLLGGRCLDLTPMGGRMVMFWSDEIPHEVLACKPDSTDPRYDRYALTIWIPDLDPKNIQSEQSKFGILRSDEFNGETWC